MTLLRDSITLRHEPHVISMIRAWNVKTQQHSKNWENMFVCVEENWNIETILVTSYLQYSCKYLNLSIDVIEEKWIILISYFISITIEPNFLHSIENSISCKKISSFLCLIFAKVTETLNDSWQYHKIYSLANILFLPRWNFSDWSKSCGQRYLVMCLE